MLQIKGGDSAPFHFSAKLSYISGHRPWIGSDLRSSADREAHPDRQGQGGRPPRHCPVRPRCAQKLGLVSFETTTPWHNGKVKFDGVPLKLLMKAVHASGNIVQALALNDYSTEIPIEDFERYNVILAMKRDGEYMPVRDKGPLWIVYPYDSDPELKSQKFYSRSAWQVKELVVK